MAKIYHYTTIDTLALILKHCTIRFNRLDKVDDLEEAMYGSGEQNINLGKYTFVSCWTKDQDENVFWPKWHQIRFRRGYVCILPSKCKF